MKLSSMFTQAIGLVALAAAPVVAGSTRQLSASSLVTCMEDSQFVATQFDVRFTPDNRTVEYNVNANISFSGRVSATVEVIAYGFNVITENVDPCKLNLKQLCPFSQGQFDIQSHSQISQSIVDSIPGIAYSVPDIDAIVYVRANDLDTGKQVACIQVDMTNGKTVNHKAVKWVTAVISGVGLLASALASSLGNSYTAAHVATNALSLFSYFQSVVIITMEAVDRVPPMASAWAQDLTWSMGLIEVNFMQRIFRWYVQATGGTPSLTLNFPTVAVLVQKRYYEFANHVNQRVQDFIDFHGKGFIGDSARALHKRFELFRAESSQQLLVIRGIKRVGYQAGIESTSIVLTGFTFFVLICIVMGLFFVIVRGVVALVARKRQDSPRIAYYQQNWRAMFKGTILRMVYIGFPQLMVLSLWEFVERDSPAVIVLAVFFFLTTVGILAWNSFKVFVIGQRSLASYNTPAYLLYSDSQVMNKYGFLYCQFEAAHYYFIVPYLAYILIKACFISFAQSSGKTQGLAIFLIELAYLVLVCIKRPYMDKSTNVIQIITSVIITLNAFFFLFFSNLFGQPAAVSAIMGVLFFIINAAFSLILLVYTIVTCTIVLLHKNPDSRYKPAKDDRASFIQQQYEGPGAADEFAALGEAAKADHVHDTHASSSGALLLHTNGSSPSLSTGTQQPFNDREKYASWASSANSQTPIDGNSIANYSPMHVHRNDSSSALHDEKFDGRH